MPCLNVPVAVGGIPGAPAHLVLAQFDALLTTFQNAVANAQHQGAISNPQKRAGEAAKIVGTMIGEFIRIHPFRNGNGRTSRLLWHALLYRFGFPPQCGVVKRPARPYGDAMAASMRGDHSLTMLLVFCGMAYAQRTRAAANAATVGVEANAAGAPEPGPGP